MQVQKPEIRNKILQVALIVDASASDCRGMASLLIRAGYDPIGAKSIEAGKVEAAKLPPGAVIVTAMRLPDGTAREFINWLKEENYGFPVSAIVENLNHADVVSIMRGGRLSIESKRSPSQMPMSLFSEQAALVRNKSHWKSIVKALVLKSHTS